ncbi:MAG TPA: methyltransferase domain-containing protein [Pseudonocardiaceae bacterium]|jgi:protein-L-isoaspartate(D-aspartate) O-methyltransferase|nr:methyltransferase domain-containing protein [Pseudonocardiaceae bacterium]
MTTHTDEWRSHAKALADLLADRGDLRDELWRAAVVAVPRHKLVPVAFQQDQNGWTEVDTSSSTGLDLAYSPTTLITSLAQRDGYQEAVSSSTKPDLMLRMLSLLDIADGDRVLEIGTGTGYNAALLSHRLGQENVFSVDVDPELVELARQRLAAIGYRPTLVAVDGDRGLAEHGPYDRIIATCAAPLVPWTWVEQTKMGGQILADLKLGTSAGNLVLLDRTEFGAQGRFTARWAGFMDMRHDLGPAKATTPETGDASTRTYETAVPMTPWRETVPWFLAHFSLPVRVRFGYQLDRDTLSPKAGTITTADGATRIEITDDRQVRHVTETGPAHIWECIQAAYDTWADLGEPRWEAFGLTVTETSQVVWFDHPASARTWQVSAATAR